MDFSAAIIDWYLINKRDLPWRMTSDPYRIWVSEIILQQTRVNQGLDYYLRFISLFPDIGTLATASEDKVMKAWQGLGYYSRARNLHNAAKMILNNYQGKFPENYQEISALKGIGEYSAAAIASNAFNLPYPVVDGNVMRLMARLKGIEEPVNATKGNKLIRELMEKLIDRQQPGIFNQAVMEFGALICTPKQPACEKCLFREKCVAFQSGKVRDLPLKKPKSNSKKRYFNYLVILGREKNGMKTWLHKRTAEDIWKNLYEFPMIETDSSLTLKQLKRSVSFKNIMQNNNYQLLSESVTIRHILTHRELLAKFYILRCDEFSTDKYLKISFDRIHEYPVPRLLDRFIHSFTPA